MFIEDAEFHVMLAPYYGYCTNAPMTCRVRHDRALFQVELDDSIIDGEDQFTLTGIVDKTQRPYLGTKQPDSRDWERQQGDRPWVRAIRTAA
jgi:hypothetical protein